MTPLGGETALMLNLEIFCNDIIEGVLKWLDDVKGTVFFISNFEKMLKRYPNGVIPYTIGIPVFL
jgi:hypothetical protein